MQGWSDAVMVRFVGEDEEYHGLPLYEAIVLKAREMHLLGATVLRDNSDLDTQQTSHHEDLAARSGLAAHRRNR
jgi:PII-like signaling protein